MIDTTQTLEIKHSKTKLIGLVALGLLMTAAAAWVLTLDLGAEQATRAWEVKAAGYVGVPFSLLCTLIAVWRLFAPDVPVLTVSPSGILDTRVATKMIPWAAVEQISTWSFHRQNIIVIKVSQDVETQIGLSRMAQWSRKANAALGADGLCITAQGLQTDYKTLHQICIAYASAAKGAEIGEAG